MENLNNSKTRVTIGYSITLTNIECGVWHSYNRRDGKIYDVKLSSMTVILGLQANLFSVAWALQNVFQVMSEDETLIFKKTSTGICFENKMTNNGGKVFLLSTKLYKSTNNAATLALWEAESRREGIHKSGRDVCQKTKE